MYIIQLPDEDRGDAEDRIKRQWAYEDAFCNPDHIEEDVINDDIIDLDIECIEDEYVGDRDELECEDDDEDFF